MAPALRLNLDGMLVYVMRRLCVVRGEGFVVWGRGGGGVLSCFSARPVFLTSWGMLSRSSTDHHYNTVVTSILDYLLEVLVCNARVAGARTFLGRRLGGDGKA